MAAWRFPIFRAVRMSVVTPNDFEACAEGCLAWWDAGLMAKIGAIFSAIISGSGDVSGDSGYVICRDDDSPSCHVDLTCRALAKIAALLLCSSSWESVCSPYCETTAHL